MKQKFVEAHMRTAYIYARLSSAKRKKVGCLVVKDNQPISIGYNGMPEGWDNNCEDDNGNTKPEVRHAEANAISKLAKSTESSIGASFFITCAPCIECAKFLADLQLDTVYYNEEYNNSKNLDGVAHLKQCNVNVIKTNIQIEQ